MGGTHPRRSGGTHGAAMAGTLYPGGRHGSRRGKVAEVKPLTPNRQAAAWPAAHQRWPWGSQRVDRAGWRRPRGLRVSRHDMVNCRKLRLRPPAHIWRLRLVADVRALLCCLGHHRRRRVLAMDFRLVSARWDHELGLCLRADRSSLRIVCPFIKERVVERILRQGRPGCLCRAPVGPFEARSGPALAGPIVGIMEPERLFAMRASRRRPGGAPNGTVRTPDVGG